MRLHLIVHDLHRGYSAGTSSCRASVRVLAGITLRWSAGERIAITGAAASGKTTLGRCLAGLRRPEQGSVTWLHDDLREDPSRCLCASPFALARWPSPLPAVIDVEESGWPADAWTEALHARAQLRALDWLVLTRAPEAIAHLDCRMLRLRRGCLDPAVRRSDARRVAEQGTHRVHAFR